jgi:hypothetical protein
VAAAAIHEYLQSRASKPQEQVSVKAGSEVPAQ